MQLIISAEYTVDGYFHPLVMVCMWTYMCIYNISMVCMLLNRLYVCHAVWSGFVLDSELVLSWPWLGLIID